MRLAQAKDIGLIRLMRQVRMDSYCVLAHQQAKLVCHSLLNSNGVVGDGIPGGVTIPLDTCAPVNPDPCLLAYHPCAVPLLTACCALQVFLLD